MRSLGEPTGDSLGRPTHATHGGCKVPGAEKYFIRSLERYLRSPLRLEPEPFCFIQVGGCGCGGGWLGFVDGNDWVDEDGVFGFCFWVGQFVGWWMWPWLLSGWPLRNEGMNPHHNHVWFLPSFPTKDHPVILSNFIFKGLRKMVDLLQFSPKQFTVGVLNATLDLAALVLVGVVGFLGSEVVLSPVVLGCLPSCGGWVFVGVAAFLGSEVVLSPVVSGCLLHVGGGCWLVWPHLEQKHSEIKITGFNLDLLTVNCLGSTLV